MPDSDFQIPKLSLAFAKIVATPTQNSWAQVYNAGSLFIALSLSTNNPDNNEAILSSIGKSFFSNLEAEFFSLESKNLKSIKSAIEKSLTDIPPDIAINASSGYFKDNILYIFLVGKGKIILRRGEKIGSILEKKDNSPQLFTASGFLEQEDTIIMQTEGFIRNIPEDKITEALKLQLPSDISESLTPLVHNNNDGEQAAIIVTYNGSSANQKTPDLEIPKNENPYEPIETETPLDIPHTSQANLQTEKKMFNFKIPQLKLKKIQIIALFLIIIIITLIVIGVFFAKTSQENTQTKELYQNIYSQAQEKYEEGKGLLTVNKSLGKDNLLKAQQILNENLTKFSSGSEEYVKLLALQSQVKLELDSLSSPSSQISSTPTELDKDNILSVEKTEKPISITQDDSYFYLLTNKSVTSIDKKSDNKKEIISNDDDWNKPIGISTYLGNIYILDQKEKLLKYAVAASGYAKSQYFNEPLPDMSQAQDLAIDGSVWIVTKDGKILKYTRGNSDNFSASELETPLSSPTKIFTNNDIDNIYILDNGNSRIVKISKNGTFKNQYTSDILGNADDFEISEDEQKATILSEGKFYELPL